VGEETQIAVGRAEPVLQKVEERVRVRAWHPDRPTGRFLAAAVSALAAELLFAPKTVVWWVRAVIGWDVFAIVLTLLAWRVIALAGPGETRARAGVDDPGGTAVFSVAMVASLFSLFAATVVLRHVKGLPDAERLLWSVLSLTAIAASWVLTHTAHTLRYAHLYYRRGGEGGLQFPGERPPCELDFAYFAFTIGMTFQVSDVLVTSPRVRRAVLLHSLLSFVYNTAILAVAVNFAVDAL
jgi:uncharacterized membrane protein